MTTGENLRHYAAGYLGAAGILIGAGHIQGARAILDVVSKFLDREDIQSPSQIRGLVAECARDPSRHLNDVAALENLFVHPANTNLELAGIRLGKG